MSSYNNLYVAHLNPEDHTKARFNVCLLMKPSLTAANFQIKGICGNIANIDLKIVYDNHANRHQLYAVVTATDATQQYSFRFNCNYGIRTDITLCTKSGMQLIGSQEFSSHQKDNKLWIYSLTLELINDSRAPYKELYDDTNLTDFELRCEGGESVSVHRNILAVSSPVLKTMLVGNWNEAKERHVQIPGVSKDTLQHFKDYIYLKKLPATPMECTKLMQLALYYMNPELQKNCAIHIAANFKLEDGWDWFEYFVANTVQHKAYNILMTLFKSFDVEKVKALEEHFSKLSTSVE